jgi:hypothetical protein
MWRFAQRTVFRIVVVRSDCCSFDRVLRGISCSDRGYNRIRSSCQLTVWAAAGLRNTSAGGPWSRTSLPMWTVQSKAQTFTQTISYRSKSALYIHEIFMKSSVGIDRQCIIKIRIGKRYSNVAGLKYKSDDWKRSHADIRVKGSNGTKVPTRRRFHREQIIKRLQWLV